MEFKIKKELQGGRYYVDLEIVISDHDTAKAKKFGYPVLTVKLSNGTLTEINIMQINKLSAYGFFTQEEADQYAEYLKDTIRALKSNWEILRDTWSHEEVL